MTGRVAIRPGEFPLVMLAIVGTIYCCVPETDQLDEVASVLVLVLVTELLASRFLWWLALPQTVLVLWSGLYGATERSSAIVGTLFAFWPVALTGGVLLALARTRWSVGAVERHGLEAIGVVAAVAVARTGALQPTVGPALVAVAVAMPLSLVAATALVVPRCRRA